MKGVNLLVNTARTDRGVVFSVEIDGESHKMGIEIETVDRCKSDTYNRRAVIRAVQNYFAKDLFKAICTPDGLDFTTLGEP